MMLDADVLREIEWERLRSLVDVNLDVADSLHASNYQLITPRGKPLRSAWHEALMIRPRRTSERDRTRVWR